MTRSKKIFFALSAVFFVLLFYASYDISRRTTFPGSRGQLKQRVKQKLAGDHEAAAIPTDTIPGDSSANPAIRPMP